MNNETNNPPEIKISKNTNGVQIILSNIDEDMIPELLCGSVESAIEKHLCMPEQIIAAVQKGILASDTKVEISKKAIFKSSILSIASKAIIGISSCCAIMYAIQGNFLNAALFAALATCFIVVELN